MGFLQIVHSRLRAGAEQPMIDLRPEFVTALRKAAPGQIDARLVRLDDAEPA